jgi:hypothetical protein
MFSSPLVLQIPSSMQMTDEQFFEFCQVNRDLRIERNKFGELLIMPPLIQNRQFYESVGAARRRHRYSLRKNDQKSESVPDVEYQYLYLEPESQHSFHCDLRQQLPF